MSTSNSNNHILDLKNYSEIKQCHLMPCSIDYKKKEINAEEYFWPTVRELKDGGDEEQGRDIMNKDHSKSLKDSYSNNPILTASFRGRPLQGRKIKLPYDYKGRMISSIKDKDTKEVKGFDEFYYWNWDEIPSNEDKVVRALKWIELSKVIHGASADLS